jgi:hypothetical protein
MSVSIIRAATMRTIGNGRGGADDEQRFGMPFLSKLDGMVS